MTDVAVSIVNTNNRELLLDCVRSLLDDQDRHCSVEIVVLDNASTDGSAAAMRERFPQVKVVGQPFRAGFGANHNTVVRATESRYVYVLNEDTVTKPGTLDALVDYLDAHPEAAAAGPRIVGPDGRQQGSAWRLMTIPVQLMWALTLGQRGAVISHGDQPKKAGAVSACALMVRREPWERVGLFDERYFIFSEEADTARRLQAVGGEMHYVPVIDTIHYGQQSTSDLPDRQINEHWRSFDLYVERWHSPLEARALRWLTGFGYLLAMIVAEVATRLPAHMRPSVADTWNPGIYRLHVRNAFRGVHGPGIRDAAEEWNREHAPAAV